MTAFDIQSSSPETIVALSSDSPPPHRDFSVDHTCLRTMVAKLFGSDFDRRYEK
jgi:hypothetical protein